MVIDMDSINDHIYEDLFHVFYHTISNVKETFYAR